MVKETKKFDQGVYKRYTIGTDYTASAKDVKRAKALVKKLRGDGLYHVRMTRTSKGIPVVWYRVITHTTGKIPVDYKRVGATLYKIVQFPYSTKDGAQKRIAESRRRGDKTPMMVRKKYGRWYVYRKVQAKY